eukprot:Gb_13042 [translate_table: standard]
MSALRVLLALSVCLGALSSRASAASKTRPKALVAQVTRDSATLLYLIHLHQKTPLQNEKFLFDLSGANLWLPCLGVYKSSTFRPVRCRSAVCADKSSCTSFCYAPNFEPGCNNNTCAGYPTNNVPGFAVTGFGQLSLDVLALSATDGKSQGPKVQFSNFVFVCADQDSFLDGLPKGASGSAGFNREKLTLPAQLSSAFGFERKFAVCLPGGNAPGAVFFGNGPYSFLPGKDVSQGLTYTPLLKSTLDSQVYYIDVRGIAVNEKKLPIDSARLKIKRGLQGTQLSSVIPYTQIATPIYTVIRDAFVSLFRCQDCAINKNGSWSAHHRPAAAER